jgi:hypothetical protein
VALTLQEVAEELARRLDAQVEPAGENPYERKVLGKGYSVLVGTFFGGWQATVNVPDQKPVTFYAEALEMLELRIKAKLTGRDHNF